MRGCTSPSRIQAGFQREAGAVLHVESVVAGRSFRRRELSAGLLPILSQSYRRSTPALGRVAPMWIYCRTRRKHVASRRERVAESNDVTQRYTAPLRDT